ARSWPRRFFDPVADAAGQPSRTPVAPKPTSSSCNRSAGAGLRPAVRPVTLAQDAGAVVEEFHALLEIRYRRHTALLAQEVQRADVEAPAGQRVELGSHTAGQGPPELLGRHLASLTAGPFGVRV